MPVIERTIEINAPIDRVFEFITDISNHPRVSPPETNERIIDAGEVPMRLGTVVKLRARYGGFNWELSSQITAFDQPDPGCPQSAYFRDEQVSGPFKRWQHDHLFESTLPGVTRLTDRFTYSAPLGLLGKVAEWLWLNRRLHRLMEHLQTQQKRLIEGLIGGS